MGSISPCWAFSKPCEHNSPFSYFIRGLMQGVLEHHRLVRAPEITSHISASPETGSEGSSQQTNSPSCPRPRSEVSDARNSPPHPTPAFDAASPLVRSRPL
jgi:hypothetical protein